MKPNLTVTILFFNSNYPWVNFTNPSFRVKSVRKKFVHVIIVDHAILNQKKSSTHLNVFRVQSRCNYVVHEIQHYYNIYIAIVARLYVEVATHLFRAKNIDGQRFNTLRTKNFLFIFVKPSMINLICANRAR